MRLYLFLLIVTIILIILSFIFYKLKKNEKCVEIIFYLYAFTVIALILLIKLSPNTEILEEETIEIYEINNINSLNGTIEYISGDELKIKDIDYVKLVENSEIDVPVLKKVKYKINRHFLGLYTKETDWGHTLETALNLHEDIFIYEK